MRTHGSFIEMGRLECGIQLDEFEDVTPRLISRTQSSVTRREQKKPVDSHFITYLSSQTSAFL